MSEIFSGFNADQAYVTAPHDHEEFMFMIAERGVMRFTDEERRRSATLAEHQFLLVPPGRAHSTASLSGRQRHFVFYVGPDYVHHALHSLSGKMPSSAGCYSTGIWRGSAALRHLLLARKAFEPTDAATHHPVQRSGTDHLLLVECMMTALSQPDLHSATPEQHGAALIRNVCAHLAENLDHPLSLDDLAAAFDISRRHLTRLFSDHAGESILSHLQRLRMQRARDLLSHTSLSMLQVAEAVGFQSPSHFSAIFARETGMNPDRWRRRARADA